MERADPLFLLIGLPTIPVMLILGKMIRWEDYVLRLWRKYSNKLQILNSIFPGQDTHTAMLPVRISWIHIYVSLTAVNLELGGSSDTALNASCFRFCISAGIGCPVPRIPAEASPLADHVSATRILCGALVFPTIATIVGKLMFSSVNSNLQRTILVSTSWISDASQCWKPSFICWSVLMCQWWIHIIQIYLYTDLYLNNSIGHLSLV